MQPKDRATLTISILALVISAITSFLNFVQTDELRAATSFWIDANRTNPKKVTIEAPGLMYVFLTNLGNRPASVLNMIVKFTQERDQSGNVQCGSHAGAPLTRFTPVVVKGGETVMVEVKTEHLQNYRFDNATAAPIGACAFFLFLTPDNTMTEIPKVLAEEPTEKNAAWRAPIGATPTVLYKRRTFFGIQCC